MVEDFSFEDIASFYVGRPRAFLPNLTAFLNLGVIVYGTMNNDSFSFHRYPDIEKDINADWFFVTSAEHEIDSIEGNHLGYLYYNIIEHLSNSYLEPPSFNKFLNQVKWRKSLIRNAKEFTNTK